MVELQEREEGQGDGGAVDLLISGLSVPESRFEQCVQVSPGEEEPEDGGGLLTPWRFSCLTA